MYLYVKRSSTYGLSAINVITLDRHRTIHNPYEGSRLGRHATRDTRYDTRETLLVAGIDLWGLMLYYTFITRVIIWYHLKSTRLQTNCLYTQVICSTQVIKIHKTTVIHFCRTNDVFLSVATLFKLWSHRYLSKSSSF